MARHLYGGQGAEYVVDPTSFRPRPGLVTTFWSAPSGGTQYVDLLDPTGSAVTSLLSVVGGGFGGQFSGPDGVTQMWADAGGSSRTLFVADDLVGGMGGVQTVNGIPGPDVVIDNGTVVTDNSNGTYTLTLSGSTLNVTAYSKTKTDQLLAAMPVVGGTVSVTWNTSTSRWETLAGAAVTARTNISSRSDVLVQWCGGTTVTPPPGMTATAVNPSYPNDVWFRADGTKLAGWIGAASAGADPFTAKILSYSPAVYLPLNELSGTVASDVSTNGLRGTYSGTYSMSQPNDELGHGSAVQFATTPTIGKVTVPHNAALNLGTGSAERWTVAYFWRPDGTSPTYHTVVGKGNEQATTAGSRGMAFWHSAGTNAGFKTNNVQYGPTSTQYGAEALSTWTWVVWTFDGTNVRLYRDGTLRYTSPAVTAYTCDCTDAFTLGTSGSPAASMYGALDEVTIIKSTLTQANISELAAMLSIPTSGGGGGGTGTAVPSGLIWSDEFNGAADSAPDSTYWTLANDSNPPNNEVEAYTTRVPTNCRLDGAGNLQIIARYEPGYSQGGRTFNYTSAKLWTYQSSLTPPAKYAHEYGYIESRIQMPTHDYTWPAFWLMPEDWPGGSYSGLTWPGAGELDIIEMANSQPNIMKSTVISARSGTNNLWNNQTNFDTGADIGAGYHLFGFDWDATQMRWWFDRTVIKQITKSAILAAGGTWPFDRNQAVILNIAIGGNLGGGTPPAGYATNYPKVMSIDYVRWYSTAPA